MHVQTAETRPFLLLFGHENKGSIQGHDCMSVHYQWFNPSSDCTLRSLIGVELHTIFYLDGIRIGLRVSTFLYAKEKALRSQSHPPLSTLQQYQHSIEQFPVTSHSSSSYDSCVSLGELPSFWAKYNIVALSGGCIL